MSGHWEVDVDGAPADLELAAQIRSREFEIRPRDGRYHIVSPRFAGGAADVKQEAEAIVTAIWTTLHLDNEQVRAIRTGSVREMTSPATWNVTLFPAPAAAVALAATATVSVGTGTSRPDPFAERARRVELAMNDARLTAALAYLAEGDWVGLWKAYEIVRKAAGGEDALTTKWTTKSDASRFRQTANYEQRHADGVVVKPSNPMTLPEGRSYIRSILSQWLRDEFGA